MQARVLSYRACSLWARHLEYMRDCWEHGKSVVLEGLTAIWDQKEERANSCGREGWQKSTVGRETLYTEAMRCGGRELQGKGRRPVLRVSWVEERGARMLQRGIHCPLGRPWAQPHYLLDTPTFSVAAPCTQVRAVAFFLLSLLLEGIQIGGVGGHSC